MSDPVNHPAHYTLGGVAEVIDVSEWLSFNLGNAVKYAARAGAKDPTKTIEDLKKSAWYIQREIMRLIKLAERNNTTVPKHRVYIYKRVKRNRKYIVTFAERTV